MARQQLQENWRFTFLREKEVNQKLAQKQIEENGHLTFLQEFCANEKKRNFAQMKEKEVNTTGAPRTSRWKSLPPQGPKYGLT